MNTQLIVENVGKRFSYDWIFRDIRFEINEPSYVGIAGKNGSGKSTLLRIMCGQLEPSEGRVIMRRNGSKISHHDQFRYIAYTGPYVELIQEYTMRELIDFQMKFMPFRSGMQTDDIVEISGLERHSEKRIGSFSSGMKQRLRLLLAICADTDILFLDEPTSFLDEPSEIWYSELLKEFGQERIVVIASNEERDLAVCHRRIQL